MNATPVNLRRRPGAPVRSLRVALVNMPFAGVERPSIQLGLLKAIADSRGHRADTFHLNLDFVAAMEPLIGNASLAGYDRLAESRSVSGDWIFSLAAFGDEAPDPQLGLTDYAYPEKAPESEEDRVNAEALLRLRNEIAPAYIESMAAAVDWSDYDVVGFTCTFQQNAASFALAQRIKAACPEVLTLFGGANFDGGMGVEWVRSMPFIDFAIGGEADESFPDLLDAIASGDDPSSIPGVVLRAGDRVLALSPSRQFEDLEGSPTPQYHEYFERLDRLGVLPRTMVALPFESARGCWWGERRHCTFCGLNGGTMAYRSKSPQRVLDEITELALDHRCLNVFAVDNIIDTGYYDTVLRELAARGRPFQLFYETKADLSRETLECLCAGGIDSFQPGIESLSSRVLMLMRKGTKAAWNVNMLRWSRYYGVNVSWNLIFGFPHERPADVREQEELLPKLVHLAAPDGTGRVWMERFSPLFEDSELFPARSMKPSSHYRCVYPDRVNLDEAAYFFDYELRDTLPDEEYEHLMKLVWRWQEIDSGEVWRMLVVEDLGSHLEIIDTRDPDNHRTWVLEGLEAEAHRAVMDTYRSINQLVGDLGRPAGVIEETLAKLVADDLVFRDGNLYLALALPKEPPPVRGRLEANPWEEVDWLRPGTRNERVAS